MAIFKRLIKPFAGTCIAAMFAFTILAGSDESHAQNPGGIAIVEAPEQGSGVCFGESAAEAFSCAVEQCMESGAYREDCYEVRWCNPSGWAVDIFKQHQEGLHWHDYLCGWQSEEDLDAAIKIACEGSAAEYLIECVAVFKWTPDGTKIEVMQ